MLKPRAIKKGDIIGITATSGFASEERIQQASDTLEAWGFKVALGRSCFMKHGYLAGEDNIRARDLNSMFRDEKIAAILCLRGGFGSTRLISHLDYEAIKRNPKLLVGFSDITALHIVLNQICGLISLHGPMAVNLGGLEEMSRTKLLQAMMEAKPIGEVRNPLGLPITKIVGGQATGIITGGNLTMICATLGTPYEIDTKGKLLLIEDIGEEPYKLDRMLTQLLHSGKLQAAAGFIIGDFNNCEAKRPGESLCIQDIFREIIVPINKPTIGNLKIGHCSPNITLPLGVEADINADEGLLYIKESATIQ